LRSNIEMHTAALSEFISSFEKSNNCGLNSHFKARNRIQCANHFKMILKLLLSLVLFSPFIAEARTFEMMGMVHYANPSFRPNPTGFVQDGGGIGYAFFGRLELGPGLLESGFLYAPVSYTYATAITIGRNDKVSSSYWTLPLLYRYEFFAPYLSIATGLDYAIEGGTLSSLAGQLTGTNAYQSHFGWVTSFQAKQDVGENLSIVFDLRYRQGLSPGVLNSRISFMTFGLGLIKHLED
jgi:hypothetical protein